MQENNKNNVKTEPVAKKRNKRTFIVIAFIIIFAIVSYISLRGNYLEILEIGEKYSDIFTNNIKYKYSVFAVNLIFIYFALRMTNKTIKKGLEQFFKEEKKEMPKLPNKSISLILSILVSVVTSGYLLQQVMLGINTSWFGKSDPVFNIDIGFYMFQMPLIETLITYFMMVVIGLAIYTVVYYIVVFNVFFDGINAQTLKKNVFIKQITNKVKVIIVAFAALTLVKTQNIVFGKFLILNDENSTGVFGAGLTDVTIKLWGYRLLAIIMVVSVFYAIKAFENKNTKKIIISLLTVPSYLIVLFIVMFGFQLIFVKTNELDKEKEYIANNIKYTKDAYNINIDEKELQNSGTITDAEVEENSETIENIPIISKDITLKTLEIAQTNTGYYSYRDSTIGKYNIDGKEKLVYVSPREIVSGGNRTYNNKTYEYTHGFGAIISSATKTDMQGNIEYIQKDFEGKNNKINVSQPRIYFGRETNNTIVTNSKNKSEFDYPTQTSQNTEYTYDGQSGLKLNFIDRFILGIKVKDLKIATSSNVTKDSKIITNRNIINRAKTLMPYLVYDDNPYMVIDDSGKQYWVLDAYTMSNKYPYSTPTVIELNNTRHSINYIRNSIKVIIDSYDGTMRFYITDKTDPIASAYKNIYPTLFEADDQEIPSYISKHFVYPEYLYNIQASMIERYHNVSTDVLYRSDDVWEAARKNVNKSATSKGNKIEPYYTTFKAIDSEKSNLGLVLPYTQLDKQNIISYLVGTCEENGKLKLSTYRFSTDSNVLGPMQLDTQLEQDETISKQIESINVSGTKLVKNMIIVPINNTLLYVEPIYQISLNESKAVPVLKKVVVASGNKVTIDDTIEEALKKLLSQSAVDIEVENTDNVKDLINAIIKANNNLETSKDAKDWELIGKDINKLQELITKLETLEEENKKKEEEINKQQKNSSNTITNPEVDVNTTNTIEKVTE